MFTQTLPAELFATQREFIKAMDGKLDFMWTAETLIPEETKELEEAYKAAPSEENLLCIFKELADVIYVVAHCYNVMPVFAPELVSEERNQHVQEIMDRAAVIVSEVTQKMQIPLPIVVAAFEIVHQSNMSKLDENGQPVRREDGKIMKGPNYKVPDMTPVVNAWKTFLKEQNA